MTLEELVDTFEFFDDWEDKYRFIIDLGKDLPALPDADKTDAHLIRGCQSQVWLTYKITDEGLKFNMDSDAHIVRGLIAVVLMRFKTGAPVKSSSLILRVSSVNWTCWPIYPLLEAMDCEPW